MGITDVVIAYSAISHTRRQPLHILIRRNPSKCGALSRVRRLMLFTCYVAHVVCVILVRQEDLLKIVSLNIVVLLDIAIQKVQ